MTNQPDHFETWQQHPTGLIPQGSFCEACGRFNSRCVTVEVVVLNSNGEVLLIQRKHDPEMGAWALPAGYLEWHETLKQAAARELGEETGVQVSVDLLQLVDIFDAPNRDADGRENVGHCYVVQLHDIPALSAGDDAKQTGWFAITDLPKRIAFDHQQMIERALQKLSVPGFAGSNGKTV